MNAVVDAHRAIPSIGDESETEFAKPMTASWYLASPSQNETRPLKQIDEYIVQIEPQLLVAEEASKYL